MCAHDGSASMTGSVGLLQDTRGQCIRTPKILPALGCVFASGGPRRYGNNPRFNDATSGGAADVGLDHQP